ncbi:hypothetical protein [Fulvivirga lutea]|uniref:Uncharacterized protein n=1 Tax=Fulvivirga lutea TaxID=2810512 RepID=A0A974WJX8_9BACT|nr:hypothetical protein [Fulvivirga lutea]QSE99173.1 hypothetical protein JR347_08820 [Fulvivirga lutea]
MKGKTSFSYDYILFMELIYEYDETQQETVEAKIKRRLKYNNLAPYDQNRVNYVRSFKKALSEEIRLLSRSKYFEKTLSKYAQVKDFDVEQMTTDYSAIYPELSIKEIRSMVGFGVHWFYTR